MTSAFPKKIESSQWINELNVALQVAKQAGREIFEIQHSDIDLQVQDKENDAHVVSPVTIADARANELICRTLISQFPNYGLLTEEAVEEELLFATKNWTEAEYAWIIDPLDGTKAFIRKGTGYGVHIGLTHHGRPVVGVNYYPETDVAYFAIQGCGAYKQVREGPVVQLRCSSVVSQSFRPIGCSSQSSSASLYDRFFGQQGIHHNFPKFDSTGLKLCRLAEGDDFNLHLSTGREGGIWDYCSGEVILKEAGGSLSDFSGNPINYRSEGGKLIHGVIGSNEKMIHVDAVRQLHKILADGF